MQRARGQSSCPGVDGYSTSALSCCRVSVVVGGAASQTNSIVQRGPGVPAAVALVGVGPVAHGAVGVARRTLPPLRVLEETLGTVQHAQAVVEEAVLLAACTHHSREGRKVYEWRWSTSESWKRREALINAPLQKNTTPSENYACVSLTAIKQSHHLCQGG